MKIFKGTTKHFDLRDLFSLAFWAEKREKTV